MICERCRGKGRIPDGAHRAGGFIVGIGDKPCPECNGCAIQHCCDGIREQPEPTDEG